MYLPVTRIMIILIKKSSGGVSNIQMFGTSFSADIAGKEQSEEQSERTVYVTANKKYDFDGIKVQTLHSTDEGVAFIVYMEDKVIYHAGDLNWWHWEEETESYNEQMRQDYQREIDKLKDIVIDIAFVPLDPRQENQYAWGMDYFMKHTHTKYVFPMHMWGDYEIYDRLMENPEAEPYKERVIEVKEPGQVFEVNSVMQRIRIKKICYFNKIVL